MSNPSFEPVAMLFALMVAHGFLFRGWLKGTGDWSFVVRWSVGALGLTVALMQIGHGGLNFSQETSDLSRFNCILLLSALIFCAGIAPGLHLVPKKKALAKAA